MISSLFFFTSYSKTVRLSSLHTVKLYDSLFTRYKLYDSLFTTTVKLYDSLHSIQWNFNDSNTDGLSTMAELIFKSLGNSQYLCHHENVCCVYS